MSDKSNELKSCLNCPIRLRGICSLCGSEELKKLEGMKYYRRYEAGQTVVWEGDEMNFVASVETGIATLCETLSDGRIQMVGLLLPSDFLGHPGRATAPYEVTANTDLLLCCFRRNEFEKLIEETPHIGQRLLEITLDELDAARDWMLVLGRKTAREKVASLIAVVAKREAALQQCVPDGCFSFDLQLSRESMANYLGLTLETVSREISALRQDRLIELDGKRGFTIPDFEALVLESGEDFDDRLSV